MSARQLNRLAKAKGLDPLLGGALNAELQESEETDESDEEDLPIARKAAGVISQALGEDSDQNSSEDTESDDDDHDDHDVDHDYGNGDIRADAYVPVANDLVVDPNVEAPPEDANEHDGVASTEAAALENLSPGDKVQPHPSTSESVNKSVPVSSSDIGGGIDTGIAADTGSLTTSSSTISSRGGDSAKGTKKNERRPAPHTEIDDDSEYLDKIISQMEDAARSGRTTAEESLMGEAAPLAQMLRCDPRCLKLDTELRRKFGRSVSDAGGDHDNGGAPGGGAAGRLRRRRGVMPRGTVIPASLALKRLIVSSPKEDWPKPPSFVGGGLGMSRCEPPSFLPKWQVEAHVGASWFAFERSDSLEQLQNRFEAIQRMHDPNLLAAFASQVPYHADALLQLGIVFAHAGQMDRASEFVGRALYVFESASMEAFRPVEGACRMDAELEVNRAYLAAMFRHMQMAGMMGGTRTALEVGRLLLSLDPLGDPMGCLVALDTHALASRQGEFLIRLYESRMEIGYSSRSIPSGVQEPPSVATVQDLPGLSMSVSLAILDTSDDVSAAREAMASALLRFPIMLEPLLEKCGTSPRTTTRPYNWKSVMHHPHFGQAQDRIPPIHVLRTMARIFAERGGEIWKHERAQELLYDGAGIALQGLATVSSLTHEGAETSTTPSWPNSAISTSAPSTGVPETSSPRNASVSDAEAKVMKTAYREGSPVHKYLGLAVSDFSDEGFARLPADANILDPRLMGPNFMNQRLRVQLPQGIGDNRQGLPGGMDALRAFVQELGHLEEEADMLRRGRARHQRGARRAHTGNLNPEAPLAQLLWQTLLPWNVFPTPSNPPPPPPV